MVFAVNGSQSSLYHVIWCHLESFFQISNIANLAEGIVNADPFQRDRAVPTQDLGHGASQSTNDVMVC